ncbi:TIM barrel protein [Paraglaciecola polaris]|uniref:Hydroxypyruvate isomerase n=1 Tax=Paraglaciecola polaris LMG 21857 TaxID=1129793 RepID=K7AH23_9ALTE|nr:TIM barrel protein [Paraglaciecola polaris]GAC34570.1 hydroxypyruvate isomerase [Paraglaciecola polaris LMG 21857]|tara:strand:- start:30925 stop:31824 length:900 start_codon:yes stop_codon:yes gene_type:complete
MNNPRRSMLKGMALTSAALAAGTVVSGCASTAKEAGKAAMPHYKGNINHSVARWTYGDLSVEELCQVVKSLGFSAIDLIGPDEWPILKRYGIDSSMCNGAELNLVDGFIHPQFHDELEKRYLKHIDLVAEAGYKNLICFSGNARGMSKEQGLKNAVAGLKRIMPYAEEKGVIIQMELFNSRIDHPDCMADSSQWGVALCKALGSPNFKLLFDIYHMQINEGDIIRTIQDHHQYFGHYHTAGVPGRHEIGDNQELYYPAIARAIKDVGFSGYLAQEFIPTPETKIGKIESLRDAIKICDV